MSVSFAAICIGLIVGAISWATFSKWVSKLRLSYRFKKGLAAERHAAKILRRYGYEMTEEQPESSAHFFVDGSKKIYQIRPDGLARKGSKFYAVEVKTGQTAVNPAFRETRRQILEYFFQLPVDGVLLVDGNAGSVKSISFSRGKSIAFPLSLVLFLLGLFLGRIL